MSVATSAPTTMASARTPRTHGYLSIVPVSDGSTLIPTNDVIPGTSHVTLGWGRDYSDVPPLQGVALGGADQVIAVEVSVTPEDPAGEVV